MSKVYLIIYMYMTIGGGPTPQAVLVNSIPECEKLASQIEETINLNDKGLNKKLEYECLKIDN